jgi:SsrA-binding protein
MSQTAIHILSHNRKARFDYEILDTLEAGIRLAGTEIKSLRLHGCNLRESFVKIEGKEAWLFQMEIPLYEHGSIDNHEPFRKRKLLMHKSEIMQLRARIERKGFSCVPLKVYLKNGRAKVLLGTGRGKKRVDKRQDLKKKNAEQEIKRQMKAANFRNP